MLDSVEPVQMHVVPFLSLPSVSRVSHVSLLTSHLSLLSLSGLLGRSDLSRLSRQSLILSHVSLSRLPPALSCSRARHSLTSVKHSPRFSPTSLSLPRTIPCKHEQQMIRRGKGFELDHFRPRANEMNELSRNCSYRPVKRQSTCSKRSLGAFLCCVSAAFLITADHGTRLKM